MRNRITRYEVELTDGHTRRYLVGYTPRRSRPGLLAAVRAHADRVIACTGLTDDHITTWPNARTLDLGNGWIVRFTGRTQIDAQDHRELTFIAGGNQ